jgi:hypothetical protein
MMAPVPGRVLRHHALHLHPPEQLAPVAKFLRTKIKLKIQKNMQK